MFILGYFLVALSFESVSRLNQLKQDTEALVTEKSHQNMNYFPLHPLGIEHRALNMHVKEHTLLLSYISRPLLLLLF